MQNPNGQQRQTWMQNGATFGGIIVAGRCMVGIVFFGFGLMLMGTIATATSSSFDDFQGRGTNPPRIIGICFLSIGGFLVLLGVVFILIAKNALNNISRENAQDQPTAVHVYPGNFGGPGAPYQSGPYPPPQIGGAYPSQQVGPYAPPAYTPRSAGPYPSETGTQYPPKPAY